jgi:hypothetical protein
LEFTVVARRTGRELSGTVAVNLFALSLIAVKIYGPGEKVYDTRSSP